MPEIENLRKEIDLIHIQIATLFRRRLAIARHIWEIKKRDSMPLIDSQREEKILHQFDHEILDEDERTSVQNIFKSLLKETKTFLEAKLK